MMLWYNIRQVQTRMAEAKRMQQMEDSVVQHYSDMQTQMAEAKNMQQMEDSAVQHYSEEQTDG